MPGQIDRLASPGELGEGIHVIAHRAIRWRDDRCRPRHHVIAGKQQIRFPQGIGQVVRGVARRRHRFERPAVARHHLAVAERDVGPEIKVGAGIEPVGLADMQWPRRAVRALRIDHGTGRGLDLRHGRRMIAMGVGDENMGHGFAAHRIEHRRDMGLVVRAGVEYRHLAAADDVTDRPLEGERTGIVGDDRAHARRHFLGAAGLKIKRLVVRDVVVHAESLFVAERREAASSQSITQLLPRSAPNFFFNAAIADQSARTSSSHLVRPVHKSSYFRSHTSKPIGSKRMSPCPNRDRATNSAMLSLV